MTNPLVRRLDLGFYVRPASETGGAEPRVEPAFAYLVRDERGAVLFDTGVGEADGETEAHYRPRRRTLGAALAAAGSDLSEVSLVVNCHLHFDHCGGNPLLAGRPVVVQSAELAAARRGGHTVDALVDFPGARYEEITGGAELRPGLRVLATPGHTAGHQSLAVVRGDGTVVLAGQAYDRASDFSAALLARRAVHEGVAPPLPSLPPWLDEVAELDPRRVVFAHDGAVWEP